MYDDQKDASSAIAAKHELSQQIFTKTMSIQVWRPEYERPGRHFVYTTRYVYFFVNLLDQLNDRTGLDQLLRRVRKKQGDFVNHTKLWEDICLTYGRVIRRAGEIKEGHEEKIFKPISWDEFVASTSRLENLSSLEPRSVALLELLRESIELKKLNNSLMKVSQLEDLTADLYSRLYELNLPQVKEKVTEENKERMKVDHILMTSTDGAADASAPTPTAGSATDAPAPRGRTKGIARRDIQKRAETIVNSKLSTRTLNAKPAGTTTGATGTTNGDADVSSHKPPTTTTDAQPSSTQPAPSIAIEKKERGSRKPTKEGENSDTELSEVDDDKLAKPHAERANIFPNLKPSPGGEPGSEVSVPASFDDDGDGNGDEDAGDADNEADPEGEGEGEGEDEGDTMVEESFDTTGGAGPGPEDENEVAEDGDDEDDDGEVGEGTEMDIEGDGDGDGEGEGEGDNEEDEDEAEPKETAENQPDGDTTLDIGNNADEEEPEPEPDAMDTQ